MGDSVINNFIITSSISNSSYSLPLSAAALTNFAAVSEELISRVSDTPLLPSHAGGKGISNHGQRPVDMVVLPRPSSPRKGREEGKASVSVPSKKGRLYLKFFPAAALLIAVVSAYVAFASAPPATSFITDRTLYLPQNLSLAGYWKLGGKAIGDDKEVA